VQRKNQPISSSAVHANQARSKNLVLDWDASSRVHQHCQKRVNLIKTQSYWDKHTKGLTTENSSEHATKQKDYTKEQIVNCANWLNKPTSPNVVRA
jgi:hypothetical protein